MSRGGVCGPVLDLFGSHAGAVLGQFCAVWGPASVQYLDKFRNSFGNSFGAVFEQFWPLVRDQLRSSISSSFGTVFGAVFGTVLAAVLERFGSSLGAALEQYWSSFEQCWEQFGGSFGKQRGSRVGAVLGRAAPPEAKWICVFLQNLSGRELVLNLKKQTAFEAKKTAQQNLNFLVFDEKKNCFFVIVHRKAVLGSSLLGKF